MGPAETAATSSGWRPRPFYRCCVQRLAQRAPVAEFGGEVEAGMGGTRRRQCQIGEVRTAWEMAIMEPPRAGAVEGDGADQRMSVEQLVDGVRLLPADRRVGAGLALADRAHVPQRHPLRHCEAQLCPIIGGRSGVEEGEQDRPEQVARMGVVFLAAQGFLAGQGAEHEHPRPPVDDRWKAALGRGGCGEVERGPHATKRPRRTAVCPLASRREGMISTQSS